MTFILFLLFNYSCDVIIFLLVSRLFTVNYKHGVINCQENNGEKYILVQLQHIFSIIFV